MSPRTEHKGESSLKPSDPLGMKRRRSAAAGRTNAGWFWKTKTDRFQI